MSLNYVAYLVSNIISPPLLALVVLILLRKMIRLVQTLVILKVRAFGASKRPNTGGVHHALGPVIVFFDMWQVEGFCDSWDAVDVAGVPVEVGHCLKFAPVGLEVRVVDSVIAGQCDPEANVRHGERAAAEEALFSEQLLNLVHAFPVGLVRELVRLLCGGETAAIHAVVDLGVHDAVMSEAKREKSWARSEATSRGVSLRESADYFICRFAPAVLLSSTNLTCRLSPSWTLGLWGRGLERSPRHH